mmetsp:Transcript_5694/g.14208  ORF Transcript_5694/g.14208 Transcript_5694/m.14208 type:complete len:224 (-) Transcript_5694:166-837(-)
MKTTLNALFATACSTAPNVGELPANLRIRACKSHRPNKNAAVAPPQPPSKTAAKPPGAPNTAPALAARATGGTPTRSSVEYNTTKTTYPKQPMLPICWMSRWHTLPRAACSHGSCTNAKTPTKAATTTAATTARRKRRCSFAARSAAGTAPTAAASASAQRAPPLLGLRARCPSVDLGANEHATKAAAEATTLPGLTMRKVRGDGAPTAGHRPGTHRGSDSAG